MAGKDKAAVEAPRESATFAHHCIQRGLVRVNGDQLYVRHGRLTVDEPAQIATLEKSPDWTRLEADAC